MDEPSKIDVVWFLDWFYKTYGPNWTLVLIFSVPVLIVGWQIFQAFRKDRESNLSLTWPLQPRKTPFSASLKRIGCIGFKSFVKNSAGAKSKSRSL